jgi:hypothetical protein
MNGSAPGRSLGRPLGDDAWLTEPDGPAHRVNPDRAPGAVCDVDLTRAQKTTVIACQVHRIDLCLTCFPSPSHPTKENDANQRDGNGGAAGYSGT